MSTGALHLAVLIPGCGEVRADGIAVSSRIGPVVERLAEMVDRITILAYDPPESGAKQEDRVDFLMQPQGANVEFVSLGPKGTYREYLSRRRRVRAIVDERSGDWDVLFLPLINRRVGLVYPRAKCARVFAQIGGHNPTVVRDAPGARYRKLPQQLAAALSERTYRRMARRELFFVNGEALLPYYDNARNPVAVLRSSARRAKHTFVAPDRFQGDPQLVVVSRITPPKGVFEALEAFGQLRATSQPRAVLHMVGNGDAEPALRARAEELGVAEAIVWHGWIPPGEELYGLVKQMDVLLALSYAESMPKTVWEAMAHSVLVVATPVGALPHVFEDGRDLLFVPVGDADAAAKAVERLASDPALRQRLIASGLASSAEVTVEAVAQQLMDRVKARWPELDDTA